MVINDKKIARAVLYLFMFSLNFEMVNLAGVFGTLSIGRITGFIYIVTLIFVKYRFRIAGLVYLFYAIMAFIMVITASSVFCISNKYQKIIDISLIQNIILFFLLLHHERNDSGVLKKSFYAFALGSAVLCITHLFGIGVSSSAQRLTIFGDNQNLLGLRLSMSIVFLIYSALLSGKLVLWKRAALMLPVPFMLSLLLLTGSRVAFISLVLMLAVLLALYMFINPEIRLGSSLIYLGLALAFLVPALLSNDLMNERLLAAKGGDLADRENIWRSFLPAVWERLIIGYGYSGYEQVSESIFGKITSPHNVFIEVLLYGGVAALALFILFNVQILFSGINTYFKRNEYIGLVFLIPYAGVLISGQALDTKMMWYILAYNSISLLQENTAKKRQYAVT